MEEDNQEKKIIDDTFLDVDKYLAQSARRRRCA